MYVDFCSTVAYVQSSIFLSLEYVSRCVLYRKSVVFYYRNVYLRVLKCVVLETPLLLIEIVEPISDLMMADLMLDATLLNPH